MRKYFCWLFGHSFLCLYRRCKKIDGVGSVTVTGWKCQHCGQQKTEQWDA